MRKPLHIFLIIASFAPAIISFKSEKEIVIERKMSIQQEVPARMLSGMGSLHHPITTTNPEAQRFFDQGLTFTYAFNFAEALHSFQRASQLDPRAAMPYWGIALANSPSYNSGVFNSPMREKAALEAIQKAQLLSAAAPENERAYIAALARRFTNDSTPAYDKLARDYAAAMDELSHRFPDDPDAAALYAESLMDLHPYHLWTIDGKPSADTVEIVSVLESVLNRWPDHIGANHFYIHAMEASPYPERALPSARRLETLAPAAGHLVHMPAHIYFRTGDYAAAVKSAVSAAEADRDYSRERTIDNSSYDVAYAEHNLYYLVSAANIDGEFQTALRAATELASELRGVTAGRLDAETFPLAPTFVLLRFSRWNDVLALPTPDVKVLAQTYFWHYARGCAFAAKGQAKDARAEREAMEQVYKQVSPSDRFGIIEKWSVVQELAVQSLDARISQVNGDAPAAIEHWRAAVTAQDQIDAQDFYREPPVWYYPLRESLGTALLRNGQPAEAEKIFRDDLARNSRNPRSLFGLWKALEAQHKTADAEQSRLLFESGWKESGLPLRIADF